MVSPNWPSDDDPDYTPDFGGTSSSFDTVGSNEQDLEVLQEELNDIVTNE